MKYLAIQGNRMQFLADFDVTTTKGDVFTGTETAKLYALIHKRFGYNNEATGRAVARMMETFGEPDQAYIDQVVELANYGRTL